MRLASTAARSTPPAVSAQRPENRSVQAVSPQDMAVSGLFEWDFLLPPELEAGEPPEARGLRRDQVRLMISRRSQPGLHHTGFRSLPDYLVEGDLLVVNTSATLNAALPAVRENGQRVVLHLSTRRPDGDWLVELRQPASGPTGSSTPWPLAEDQVGKGRTGRIRSGEILRLPGGRAGHPALAVPENPFSPGQAEKRAAVAGQPGPA